MYYITAKVKDEDNKYLQCYLAYNKEDNTNYWSTWNIRLYYIEEIANLIVSQMSACNYYYDSKLGEDIDIDSIKVVEFKE